MDKERITAEGIAGVSDDKARVYGAVPIRVSFDPEQPLIITLETAFLEGLVEWELSRDLVHEAAEDGMLNDFAPIGEGDITLKVRRTDNRLITLRAPFVFKGEKRFTYLVMGREELLDFVHRTYDVVSEEKETAMTLQQLDDIEDILEGWKKNN
jgi:Streptomyces sporulation and cell division protein, SsgA